MVISGIEHSFPLVWGDKYRMSKGNARIINVFLRLSMFWKRNSIIRDFFCMYNNKAIVGYYFVIDIYFTDWFIFLLGSGVSGEEAGSQLFISSWFSEIQLSAASPSSCILLNLDIKEANCFSFTECIFGVIQKFQSEVWEHPMRRPSGNDNPLFIFNGFFQ